jgi:hypothetical protein
MKGETKKCEGGEREDRFIGKECETYVQVRAAAVR